MKKLNVFLAVIFSITVAHATVWYVHPDSTMSLIQEGLDSCATGDTVLAGPGVYYENVVWPNVQDIYLIGEQGSNNTIVNGMLMDYAFSITTNINTSTHIRGLGILDGYGDTGGGIYCDSASPTIEYCHFQNNESSGTIGGGAIACANYASPTISHCYFHDNTSSTYPGGGILCYAYSSPMIHACNIIHNTGDPGAGISVAYGCFPVIDSCTISDNYGHGIYFGGGDGQVHYCNITNNAAYGLFNGDVNFTIEAENNWWGHSSGPGGAGPGSGDEVSTWVTFSPWLTSPVTGVKEDNRTIISTNNVLTTIFSGPLHLPGNENCKVIDITGREVDANSIQPGIYFIEIEGNITHKVIKIK